MVDQSKTFRTGIITNKAIVSRELALSEDSSKTIPYVCFEIESMIPIGLNEVHKELTNVVLLGEEPVSVWRMCSPAPSAGDMVKLNYVTSYVKDGCLCVRVLNSEQLEVFQKEKKHQATDALDVFRQMFEERKGKQQ